MLIIWPPDMKSQLTGQDPYNGKDRRQKEKGVVENEMVRIIDSMDMNLSKLWEMSEGQVSLTCHCPWGHKESETT